MRAPIAESFALVVNDDAELLRAQEDELRELRELRELLELQVRVERTSHTMIGEGARCGDVATNGLRKLDDGQNDSVAMLHRRRKQEDEAAARSTGRDVWDSTPFKEADAPKPIHVPMRKLEEESTFVERVYKPMMKAKSEDRKGGSSGEAPARAPIQAKHAEMIEQMMRAYRHETGAPKTMRSPRTGRLREIQDPMKTGRIALGKTVARSRSAPLSRGRAGAPSVRSAPAASPQQEALRGRAEAAKAEAAAKRHEAKSIRVS